MVVASLKIVTIVGKYMCKATNLVPGDEEMLTSSDTFIISLVRSLLSRLYHFSGNYPLLNTPSAKRKKGRTRILGSLEFLSSICLCRELYPKIQFPGIDSIIGHPWLTKILTTEIYDIYPSLPCYTTHYT